MLIFTAQTIFHAADPAKQSKAQEKGARAAPTDDGVDILQILGMGTGDVDAVFIESFGDADDQVGRNDLGKASVIAADDVIVAFSADDAVQDILSVRAFNERERADGERVHSGDDFYEVAGILKHGAHTGALNGMHEEAAIS